MWHSSFAGQETLHTLTAPAHCVTRCAVHTCVHDICFTIMCRLHDIHCSWDLDVGSSNCNEAPTCVVGNSQFIKAPTCVTRGVGHTLTILEPVVIVTLTVESLAIDTLEEGEADASDRDGPAVLTVAAGVYRNRWSRDSKWAYIGWWMCSIKC